MITTISAYDTDTSPPPLKPGLAGLIETAADIVLQVTPSSIHRRPLVRQVLPWP